MGLSAQTRIHLQGKGILIPDNLIDFTKQGFLGPNCGQLQVSCQDSGSCQCWAIHCSGGIPAPHKIINCIKVSAKAMEYYSKTDRPLTVPGITYEHLLKNFKVEWDSLQKRKSANNDSAIPLISKTFPITQWFEAHEAFNSEYIGQSGCPLP